MFNTDNDCFFRRSPDISQSYESFKYDPKSEVKCHDMCRTDKEPSELRSWPYMVKIRDIPLDVYL